LNAQDLIWVFVHRFLSKVLEAPGSCLASGYGLPTRIGQCHIIALEVQYLSRQFWRAAPALRICDLQGAP
jgi:hypothetical protein